MGALLLRLGGLLEDLIAGAALLQETGETRCSMIILLGFSLLLLLLVFVSIWRQFGVRIQQLLLFIISCDGICDAMVCAVLGLISVVALIS